MSQPRTKRKKKTSIALVTSEQAKKLTADETNEDIRKLLTKNLRALWDPDALIDGTGRALVAEVRESFQRGKRLDRDSYVKKADEVGRALWLDNHYGLAHIVREDRRPMLLDTVRRIEQEFECETASEKILAEIVAGAHARILQAAANLSLNTGVSAIAVLSKEIDRAHRQLATALDSLRRAKTPPFQVNVQVKTAFVAQNQQVNAVMTDKKGDPETNDAK